MVERLEFYRTIRGDEPALDYIRAQAKAHKAKIGFALQCLKDLGHLARRPMVEYLGGDSTQAAVLFPSTDGCGRHERFFEEPR